MNGSLSPKLICELDRTGSQSTYPIILTRQSSRFDALALYADVQASTNSHRSNTSTSQALDFTSILSTRLGSYSGFEPTFMRISDGSTREMQPSSIYFMFLLVLSVFISRTRNTPNVLSMMFICSNRNNVLSTVMSNIVIATLAEMILSNRFDALDSNHSHQG